VSGAPVALVTGGTRGIGLGIARALAQDGWALALCGMRPPGDVASVLTDLRAGGAPEVAYWPADVSRREDRSRLVSGIETRFSRLHALVNNAGKAPSVRADLLDASEESFEDLMRTNLQGPYFLTQAASRLMLHEGQSLASGAKAPPPQQHRGGIVFVTSVSAELASLNRGEYCVSKAGLAMAAQLFALRLAPSGIPVYEVRPGVIATDMTAKVKAMYDARIADGLVPEGRWGYPDDVGRAVAALLRGDLPYATGSVVHVAGGLQIGRL
jgi:NAD(P)-dependent dehydrogenase (short-subunit alcohol dehydrogenase family)